MPSVKIGDRIIGGDSPTYFIADISANHDGDLQRAKHLIHVAAEAGADAAKFQNFRAPHIVSDKGFRDLGSQLSHQAKWKTSVTEVYATASLPWEWTEELRRECDAAGIHYFSAPYDLEAVDMLDPHVPAFKIGSGDITWPTMLEHIAMKQKPVLLATGASSLQDVVRAVDTILSINSQLILMQCNTNYTGDAENFRHIHLNVLRTFGALYPAVTLGLSDHTTGHATVLGAVALGARAVEKHFTDDTSREGPDHSFSMTPRTWRAMVDSTRELEAAMGSAVKRVADNEQETVVIQRRALRATHAMEAGALLHEADLEPLRPAPVDAIYPYDVDKVIGRRLRRPIESGEHLTWSSLE
jgi:N-acetylneuraminate synthase